MGWFSSHRIFPEITCLQMYRIRGTFSGALDWMMGHVSGIEFLGALNLNVPPNSY